MRYWLIILLSLSASNELFAYNIFWIHSDRRLISTVTHLNKNNPREIEDFFKTQRFQKNDTTKENLGFGWKMWSPGIGVGYISIRANFFYFHDSLVSYSLFSRLPEEKKLQKRYRKWYVDSYLFSDSIEQQFSFNESAISGPLNLYNKKLPPISQKIARYMTPYSGTTYGYYGFNTLLQNRESFLEIRDSLTNEQVILLLYSINPASRMTAVEYYWRHQERFSPNEKIDQWIETIFEEMPEVQTTVGCFNHIESSKWLVFSYAQSKEPYRKTN